MHTGGGGGAPARPHTRQHPGEDVRGEGEREREERKRGREEKEEKEKEKEKERGSGGGDDDENGSVLIEVCLNGKGEMKKNVFDEAWCCVLLSEERDKCTAGVESGVCAHVCGEECCGGDVSARSRPVEGRPEGGQGGETIRRLID